MSYLRSVIKTLYNVTIRPWVPRKIASLNGIPVRYVRLLDTTDVIPDYELALIRTIREQVNGQSSAVIIGGGAGVSTITTARNLDPNASVTVFEAGEKQVDLIKETIQINAVRPTIQVNHTVVGNVANAWSSRKKANQINPAEIPDCEMLVMDCEGSEKQILKNLTIKPELIIVETHGYLDSSTEEIVSILEKQNYSICSERVEITEKDVHVLAARYNRGSYRTEDRSSRES